MRRGKRRRLPSGPPLCCGPNLGLGSWKALSAPLQWQGIPLAARVGAKAFRAWDSQTFGHLRTRASTLVVLCSTDGSTRGLHCVAPSLHCFCCSSRRSSGDGPGPDHRDWILECITMGSIAPAGGHPPSLAMWCSPEGQGELKREYVFAGKSDPEA